MSQLMRLIKDRFGRAPLVVMAIIPLLYGSIYLSAFWNPVDNLDRVPVALVNLDAGAVDDNGEAVRAGDEVVDHLEEEKPVDWVLTSAEEAQTGLEAGRYYAVLTLTKDFSKNAVSVGTDHAEHPQLEVTYNDASGYTTRTILSSVIREIRSAISATLGEEMASQILVGLDDLREGLSTAADGAGELADGADQAEEGSGQLADGADTVAVNLKTLADSLAEAAPGAATIAQGSRSIADGLAQVDDKAGALPAGLQTLGSGADQLNSGLAQAVQGAQGLDSAAGQLATGAKSLAAGLTTLDGSVAQLPDQAEQLHAGASTVAHGNASLADAMDGLGAQYAQSTDQLRLELAKELPADSPALAAFDAQVSATQASLGSVTDSAHKLVSTTTRLAEGTKELGDSADSLKRAVQKLADGGQNLASGAATLASATPQLASALGQAETGAGALAGGLETAASSAGELTGGLHRLAEGAGTVADGNQTLASGLQRAKNGSNALAEGSAELAGGVAALHDGLGTLAEGSAELSSGLSQAREEVPELTEPEREANAAVLADPVELDSNWVHEAATNGEGFAPYFIGLTLYLGALIIWMVMSPLVPRAVVTSAPALRVVALSLRPAALIGLVQAAILLVTLRFGSALGLGLEVDHFWWFLGFGFLTSLAYTALLQMLAVSLGNGPGRLLSLILLLLQLASAGGTYPAVTSPAFFQWLNPILPMTYVVNGFRATITGDLNSTFVTAVIYLAVQFVVCVVITMLATRRARFWSVARLHPAVSL